MASRRLQIRVTRAELYVDPSPPRNDKRKHTKVCVNTVRHLDSGSTTDGAAHFTWLQASEAIAKLVVFGSTSTGEFQVRVALTVSLANGEKASGNRMRPPFAVIRSASTATRLLASPDS